MRTVTIIFITALILGCSREGAIESTKQRQQSSTLSLAEMNGCLNCHDINSYILAPPWKTIAERYRGSSDARTYLIEKVKKGGGGAWTTMTGGALMPPNSPRVSDKHIEELVDFILALE